MRATLLTILTLSSLLPSVLSFGATLQIEDSVIFGNPTSTSINPGDSFSVTISISSAPSETLAGLSYFLTSAGPTTGVFQITGRDTISSSFSDLTTTNPNVVLGGSLDPVNNNDLGGSLADVFSPIGPGTFFVSTINFSSLASTPVGVYTITFPSLTASYLNGALDEQSFSSLGSYTVTVIPEPTTMALLAGSLTAIMVLRRRRTS